MVTSLRLNDYVAITNVLLQLSDKVENSVEDT